MRNNNFYLPVILLIIYMLSYCDVEIDIQNKVSSTFFPFLKIDYDARSFSMGSTGAGIVNNIAGVFSNPASLGYINKKYTMISYRPVILDIQGGVIAFASPFDSSSWNIAVNMIYLSHGKFSAVDQNNRPLGVDIHPYSITGGFSISRVIAGSLSAGATVKGIYEQLNEKNVISNKSSISGLAADIGLQYKTIASKIVYGIMFRNIGVVTSPYKDYEKKSSLPFSVSAGFAATLPSVIFAFDLEKAVDDYLLYKSGVEFSIYRNYIYTRIGSNISQNDLEQLIRILKSKDDSANKPSFYKSDATLLNFGIGINSNVNNISFCVDAGIGIRVLSSQLPVAFIISLSAGF